MHGPAATRPGATVTFLIAPPLVEVEVAVYNAIVSDHGIKRSTFTLDGHPVGNQPYDKVTGETVTDTVKKIETEYGWVFVEDHEVEQLFAIKPNTLVLKAVQPQHLFYSGAYVPKSPMIIEAAKRKVGTKKVPNQGGQQLLATFLQALADEGAVAICELTTRGVPKPCVLLSDGTLWIVYHDDEVREPRPKPEVVPDNAVVKKLRELIKPFADDSPLDLTDRRTEKIQEFAENKGRKGDFDVPETPDVVVLPETTSTTEDLMALLDASIAQSRESA